MIVDRSNSVVNDRSDRSSVSASAAESQRSGANHRANRSFLVNIPALVLRRYR